MVSPVIPAIARRVVDRSPSSCSRVYDIGSMEGSGVGEIVEEEVVVGAGEEEEEEEEKLYVAVGKEVKESRSALVWAVQNSEGKRICLLHVLVPSATIPMMGAEVPASSAKAQVVRAHRESERQNMHKALNVYHRFCVKMGAQPEKLFVESDSVENGLMELIQRHGIKNLVMGAASDRRYKRNMTELKSKKAIFLKSQAPASCIINFICKGHVVLKREGSADASARAVPSLPVPPPIIIPDVEPPSISRPTPTTLPNRNDSVKFTNPVQDIFSRVFPTSSERRAGRTSTSSLPDSPVHADSRANESEAFTRRSPSHGSAFSSSSSSSGGPDIISTPVSRSVGNERRSWSIPEHVSSDQTSASISDGSMDDSFLDQLEQAINEVEKAKQEALLEAVRRGKAEKDVIESVRKVKSLESLYAEEHRKRIDVEDSLAKEEEELGGMKNQLEEVKEEILLVSEQKLLLQRRLEETDEIMRELEQKIVSAVGLLQTYKEERDKLQFERDNALREAEELRRNQGNFSGSSLSQYYTEFPFPEIVEATQNFHPSLKIGEGGYGSIFKGSLRHTTVAIKILHEQGMQGPKEFQQEVDVLSKVRHPNLVALIGTCPEAWALVYEYLPNGSLEDRLSCRGNTMPLSWKTRIRIAAELCSALVFLHSSSPQSIIHGDLKPGNVLLDAHLVSKLSDFGICRFISRNASSSNNTTLLYKTENPRGTLQYMDPEFLSSGELSMKSDVYSFGVILLRLLTGKSALGIIKEVQNAVESGNLKSTLDPLAGDWPYLQAEQLARLALRCCDMNRKNRPDLGSDVWRLLEPMRASCGGFSCFFDERCQPPLYFICPILQEVMRDPHVAADGFTYEAEALRGWLESGHNTSPMTNELLPHRNLVPNRALRTAIQEWLQNQKESLR
ncbi:hypothetical protein MLD38_018277 [Melastoma candidum]|uniref:Uncharacterized protein n=1 Tax=Melastoma candidum TaxID=119954 RepID=A0ACB9QTC2_9MYRT|nr:hypothetical protein MLD38_018277 [Melastoma candidum]